MSLSIQTLVLKHGPANLYEKFVLSVLAFRAREDTWECWPSLETIAQETSMSKRGVIKILARLEAGEWLEISRSHGRGNSNVYRINQNRYLELTEEGKPEPGSSFVDKEKVNRVTPNGEPRSLFPNGEKVNRVTLKGEPGDIKGEPRSIKGEPRSPEPKGTEKNLKGNLTPVTPTDQNPPDPPVPERARLPDGWVPDESGMEYARSLHLTNDDITEIGNDFLIYWQDRRDAGSRKSERGWNQAWRNRCRSVAPQFIRNQRVAGTAGPGGYGQGSSIASIVARRRIDGKN